MNSLQRLIRKRMVDLDLTFREVAAKGGLPYSTVSTLAHKADHKQVPRLSTIEKLAKGLDVPVEVVRSAAIDAAGFRMEEISVPIDTAGEVRIIAAIAGQLSNSDRTKLLRLAEAFKSEIDAEANEETGRG